MPYIVNYVVISREALTILGHEIIFVCMYDYQKLMIFE